MITVRNTCRAKLAAFAFSSLASLLFAAAASAASEQRCQELGSSCVCSETLDFDDKWSHDNYDPPNSTSKECRGGKAIGSTAGGETQRLSQANAPSMPSGNSIDGV